MNAPSAVIDEDEARRVEALKGAVISLQSCLQKIVENQKKVLQEEVLQAVQRHRRGPLYAEEGIPRGFAEHQFGLVLQESGNACANRVSEHAVRERRTDQAVRGEGAPQPAQHCQEDGQGAL